MSLLQEVSVSLLQDVQMSLLLLTTTLEAKGTGSCAICFLGGKGKNRSKKHNTFLSEHHEARKAQQADFKWALMGYTGSGVCFCPVMN